jgi:hypothetical protein
MSGDTPQHVSCALENTLYMGAEAKFVAWLWINPRISTRRNLLASTLLYAAEPTPPRLD